MSDLAQLRELERKLEKILESDIEADWEVCLVLLEQRQTMHEQLISNNALSEDELQEVFAQSLANNEKLLAAAHRDKPAIEKRLIDLAKSKRAHKLYE
ncbi:hypothetical protein ACR0ST_01445 [Aliidiomarina sp. Khilg15.8]